MEALAAVGLVSNVLQLIECGYKVVLMTKELHESRQDSTQSNNNTAFVAQEMRELSARVMKDLPSSGLTEDEMALCRLAQQCSDLSNKLLALLEDLKTKKPGSKLDIITTVLRNMRKKNERNEIKANLDDYRKQLQIQISTMSRSDLAQKLEQTLSATSMSQKEMLHLRDHVQRLQHSVMVDSDNTITFFQKLQEVVEIPFKQAAILQSLRYPRMHDRFENVETAHQKTFQWLLEGPETPSDQEQRESAVGNSHNATDSNLNTTSRQAKYQQHREFSTWLRGGLDNLHADIPGHDITPTRPYKENIFHITGKPGAGKSTLMKYLCQSEITLKHLKAWAGEKNLILAKAFFWRLGDDEQKNLAGLTACLLHQILKAAPGLIPVAFPSQWESGYENIVPFDPSGTQAFNLLLRSGRAFENHKMIFFIDGLDEFSGRPIGLIKEIISWTTINPVCLKICVSSRPWNEFEIGFKDYRSFRIHEWTREDIKIFVEDRFEEFSEISSSVSKDDLNSLANEIVDKAEGVFLWVRVVLAAIEQGVLNGDEVRDLRRKVAAFPTELNDLYQHLLDSIPEYDRQKAFELLSFTYDIGIRIPVPILQHKFLSDLSIDPDFAIKLPVHRLPEVELRRVVDIARRQVNGLCKGFLEVVSIRKDVYKEMEGVRFMHATAVEFLSKHASPVSSYLSGIDTVDRTCQSFLAFIKSISMNEFYDSKRNSYRFEREFMFQLSCIMEIFKNNGLVFREAEYSPKSKSRFLGFLDHVEQIVHQRFQKGTESKRQPPLYSAISYEDSSSYSSSLLSINFIIALPLAQLITGLAAQDLLFEYFDRDGRCDLRTQTDPEFRKLIMHAVISGASGQLHNPRAFQMFEMLFKAEISPNAPLTLSFPSTEANDNGDDNSGLWAWVLRRLLFMDPQAAGLYQGKHKYNGQLYYRLIELFVRYGASEDFTLTFGPCYEGIGSNRLIVRVHAGNSNCQRTILDLEMFRDICVDYQLDIVSFARERGGVLTLRDLFAYWFPQDCSHLYALLDKRCPISPATEDTIEPCDPHFHAMPVVFPKEHRCFKQSEYGRVIDTFRMEEVPDGYRQCLSHSEKCFRDFEAKLENKGLKHLYKMQHERT
ncbi:hypothetical protein F5Y00DRAFT_274615 [Daldinia vernicosa]|uniref:uncharacterized protein n=1 Tax=Daldinia vernicosa TaxID=114800 RepID=UPI0020072831|nr:uncharacterized protein F5Y00DRAFT_274615 [Daldinia vernicosa]KAI0851727.1 hypothetical protein F5Y00DRAFT_274615 [Daldinia vernicosa]